MTDSVVLVGFMGAGKTAVGRRVAAALGLLLTDTDALIGDRFGPIPDLFETRGERGFRDLEREVVLAELEVAQAEPRVLSLGGGAVTIDDVRQALTRLPHVVWLDAPPEVLFRRASSEPGSRPLARDEAVFRALYEQRAPLYREVATIVVRDDGEQPADVLAARVLTALAAPA
ncbi:MAG TPA: shikimate kinase [Thermoleophilia bacterium]|nr:shikimate kinase [Thermoleophilia bacterium]